MVTTFTSSSACRLCHRLMPMTGLLTRRCRLEAIGNIVEVIVRRLVGAVLLEQNDEWQLQHRYLTLETMTGMAASDEAALAALIET